MPGDVTDPKWPALVVKRTIEAFGKLNLIINNAGYTWDAMVGKTTDKQWEAMLAVHQVCAAGSAESEQSVRVQSAVCV